MEITDPSILRDLLRSDGPVLVEIGSAYCPPCWLLEDVMKELEEEFRGRVEFYRVDVGIDPELMRRFAVQSIPRVLLIRGGRVVGEFEGYYPRDAVRLWLVRCLSSAERG